MASNEASAIRAPSDLYKFFKSFLIFSPKIFLIFRFHESKYASEVVSGFGRATVRFSVSSDGRKSLFLSEKLKNGSKSFSAKEGKTFPSFSAYKSRSDEKANLRKKY